MKSPIDVVKGRVIDYDERTGEVVIRAKYDDWLTMTKREYKTCLVQLIDNRPLSDKQRKACYALLGEISDYTGQSKEQTKEWIEGFELVQGSMDDVFLNVTGKDLEGRSE